MIGGACGSRPSTASTRCARCRWRRSTRRRSSGSTRSSAGSRPGARATFNVLPEIGEWRPETVYVDGEVVARDGALVAALPDVDWPAGPGLVAPDAEAVRAADRHAAGRALRVRGDQPARRPRGGAGRRPGRARRAATARGPRRASSSNFLDVDGFATTATTSLELLVLGTRSGRDGPRGGAGGRDGRRLRVRRRLVGAAGDRRADLGRRLRHAVAIDRELI